MRKTRSTANKDVVLGSGVKGKNLYSVLSGDNDNDVIDDGEVGGESTIWEGDSKKNSPTGYGSTKDNVDMGVNAASDEFLRLKLLQSGRGGGESLLKQKVVHNAKSDVIGDRKGDNRYNPALGGSFGGSTSFPSLPLLIRARSNNSFAENENTVSEIGGNDVHELSEVDYNEKGSRSAEKKALAQFPPPVDGKNGKTDGFNYWSKNNKTNNAGGLESSPRSDQGIYEEPTGKDNASMYLANRALGHGTNQIREILDRQEALKNELALEEHAMMQMLHQAALDRKYLNDQRLTMHMEIENLKRMSAKKSNPSVHSVHSEHSEGSADEAISQCGDSVSACGSAISVISRGKVGHRQVADEMVGHIQMADGMVGHRQMADEISESKERIVERLSRKIPLSLPKDFKKELRQSGTDVSFETPVEFNKAMKKFAMDCSFVGLPFSWEGLQAIRHGKCRIHSSVDRVLFHCMRSWLPKKYDSVYANSYEEEGSVVLRMMYRLYYTDTKVMSSGIKVLREILHGKFTEGTPIQGYLVDKIRMVEDLKEFLNNDWNNLTVLVALEGLGSKYSMAVSTRLANVRIEDWTLNDIDTLVVNVDNPLTGEKKQYNNNVNSVQVKGDISIKTCYGCGKQGHIRRDCRGEKYVNKIDSSATGYQPAPRKCFRCGSNTHYSPECPIADNVKCTNCERAGHLAAACMRKSIEREGTNNMVTSGTRPESGKSNSGIVEESIELNNQLVPYQFWALMDSGANVSCTGDPVLQSLMSKKVGNRTITTAADKSYPVEAIGDLVCYEKQTGICLPLQQVLYTSSMTQTIVSVDEFVKGNGATIVFGSFNYVETTCGKILPLVRGLHNQWYMEFEVMIPSNVQGKVAFVNAITKVSLVKRKYTKEDKIMVEGKYFTHKDDDESITPEYYYGKIVSNTSNGPDKSYRYTCWFEYDKKTAPIRESDLMWDNRVSRAPGPRVQPSLPSIGETNVEVRPGGAIVEVAKNNVEVPPVAETAETARIVAPQSGGDDVVPSKFGGTAVGVAQRTGGDNVVPAQPAETAIVVPGGDGVVNEDVFVNENMEAKVQLAMKYHWAFNHAHFEGIRKLMGVPIPSDLSCEVCVEGKLKTQHTSVVVDCNVVFDLMHSDVFEMPSSARGGEVFVRLFVDEVSSYVMIYGHADAPSSDNLIQDLNAIYTQTNKFPKQLHSDCGTDYESAACKRFMDKNHIKHTGSVPHHHSGNGKAERSIQTIGGYLRTTLAGANVPERFWWYVMLNIKRCMNMLPRRHLGWRSPVEVMTGFKPDITKEYPIGCLVFYRRRDRYGKLDVKAKRGFYLGRDDEKGGAIIVGCISGDPSKSERYEVLRSADVKVKPNTRFFEESGNPMDESEVDMSESEWSEDDYVPSSGIIASVHGLVERLSDEMRKNCDREKGKENVVCSVRVKDMIMDRYPTKMPVPNSLKDVMRLPEAEKKKWNECMKAEFNAVSEKAGKWVKKEESRGCMILQTRWVYAKKDDEVVDGKVIEGKCKARLVCRGDQQSTFRERYNERVEAGEEVVDSDYSQSNTYAPTAPVECIRMVMALYKSNGWKHVSDYVSKKTGDVTGAFLEGGEMFLDKVKYKIFVKMPSSEYEKEGMIMQLIGPWYGIEEAPYIWSLRLKQVLAMAGFEETSIEMCCWVSKDNGGRVNGIVVFWVDDIYFDGSAAVWTDLANVMEKEKIKFKDTGGRKFVGMEMVEKGDCLLVHHKTYIEGMLERFDVVDEPSVRTPMDAGEKLGKAVNVLEDVKPYMEIVGSLIHESSFGTPTIKYAVGVLSRYMNSCGSEHMVAAKRVLKYLKGMKEKGTRVKGGRDFSMEMYVDANWAGSEGMKSTIGFVILVNGFPVVNQSKMMKSIALSSMESETFALSQAVRSLMYVRDLYEELGFLPEGPTQVWVDNQSAIAFVKNEVSRPPAKHIRIRVEHVREALEKKWIIIDYKRSNENLADINTKALSYVQFVQHEDSLIMPISDTGME